MDTDTFGYLTLTPFDNTVNYLSQQRQKIEQYNYSLFTLVKFLERLNDFEPCLVKLVKFFLFTKYSALNNKFYIDIEHIALFYCGITNTTVYLNDQNKHFKDYISEFIESDDTIISYTSNSYMTINYKKHYTIKNLLELKTFCFQYFNKFNRDIIEINRQIQENKTLIEQCCKQHKPDIVEQDKQGNLKNALNLKVNRNEYNEKYFRNIEELMRQKLAISNSLLVKQNKYSFM